jgi:hypothetical protein
VDWDQLKAAHAGELLNTLDDAAVTHLLVVESKKNQAPIVRALVSRARLFRQLRGLRKTG